MESTVEEYSIAVKDGTVTDPAEYQDAWGFVKVARAIAEDLEGAEVVRGALDQMLALWPDNAPIPPEDPALPGVVAAIAQSIDESLPE